METMNFLSPLKEDATKTFLFENGRWVLQSSYKAGKWFKPFQIKIDSLEKAYQVLTKAQNASSFLIHGAFKSNIDLTQPIVRRKRINPQEPDILPTIQDRKLTLMCLDVDGYDKKEDSPWEEQIESFLTELPAPFSSADYIYQLSASCGLNSSSLKCHLFFWLKEPVHNLSIQVWINRFNKQKDWGNLIDPAILTCTQPIFTQRRICIGSLDPVKQDIGYVKKDGGLDFDFFVKPMSPLKELPVQGTEEKYDLAEGVSRILSATNFHDEINKLALSLLNKGYNKKDVVKLIEGTMYAAKEGLDQQRLVDWETRFRDIPRSVDSASAIVDNPTIAELEEWVINAPPDEVKNGFHKKALSLSPLDMKLFIDAVELKLGVGIQNIKDTIRIAKKAKATEDDIKKRKKKTALRKRKGIHEVTITLSNTEEVCDQVGEILANSKNGDGVFKTSLGLVRVGLGFPSTVRQVMKKNELGTDYPEMPIIQYYKAVTLGARIEKDVVFMTPKGKEIPCPGNILKILEEGTNPHFKPLSGITEHPFVNKRFDVIQNNGYDQTTGLYTSLHHKLKLDLIKPQKAYEYLSNVVLDEFPFASDLDKCVAIAAMMTCIQRPIVAGDSGFPGFGIISPVQSSGKTTLAQLISYSIYNRAVAASSFSHDESEQGKRITAILKEGHSCVLFDNLPAGTEVKSNELAKAMSSDSYSNRILGETKTVSVPSVVVWLFTGNSIYFVGDFSTRIYPINLNPRMESPDTRSFKRQDIGQWACDNRKRIISALISLIMEAKKEIKMDRASRFPVWDRFVRQPLYSVTGIDINKAIEVNRNNDGFRQSKMQLFKLLKKHFGEKKEFGSRDVIKAAFSSFDGSVSELGETLLELLDAKAKNVMSIGKLFGRLKNVVLDGLTLQMGSQRKWYVMKAEDSTS